RTLTRPRWRQVGPTIKLPTHVYGPWQRVPRPDQNQAHDQQHSMDLLRDGWPENEQPVPAESPVDSDLDVLQQTVRLHLRTEPTDKVLAGGHGKDRPGRNLRDVYRSRVRPAVATTWVQSNRRILLPRM